MMDLPDLDGTPLEGLTLRRLDAREYVERLKRLRAYGAATLVDAEFAMPWEEPVAPRFDGNRKARRKTAALARVSGNPDTARSPG